MQPETPVYERIVLKLSGEAMQERGGRDNISTAVVHEIAQRIKLRLVERVTENVTDLCLQCSDTANG